MLVRARTWARSAFLGVLIGACGGDDPTPSRPTTKPRGYAPQAVVETQPSEQPSAKTPVFRPRPTVVQEPDEAAPIEAAKEEKPRDYSAELLAAARGAESCVQPRPASQVLPEISVSLEGLVLESGTIATGSARAPALTPEELECMKKRLESARLAPGVKDAPRRVNASLRLTRPPAPAPPTAAPVQAGAAPTGAENAAPAAPTPNPDEDLPEPVAPQDQDQPEAVPTENQDLPEEVLPSQN